MGIDMRGSAAAGRGLLLEERRGRAVDPAGAESAHASGAGPASPARNINPWHQPSHHQHRMDQGPRMWRDGGVHCSPEGDVTRRDRQWSRTRMGSCTSY